MSATPTSNKNFIKVVGITTFVAGIIFLLAGFGTWMMVSSQLKAENITVSSDAKWFADKQVAGLFTAYSQADIINTHALKGSNGKTYADLGAEMAKIDDKESAEYKELATQRASVMNGSSCAPRSSPPSSPSASRPWSWAWVWCWRWPAWRSVASPRSPTPAPT